MYIHVFGYGFTGSGALLDWMKDRPDLCVAPKIKGFMGRHGVGELLLATGEPQRQQDMARARLAELEREIRNRPLKTRLPGYRAGRNAINALRTALGVGRRTGVHLTSTEVEGIEGWLEDRRFIADFLARLEGGGEFDAFAFWQEWLRCRVRQYCGDARHVALDKCLPFTEEKYDGVWERVFDPARVVVAHRDPADQCAELGRRVGWDRFVRKGKYMAAGEAEPAANFLATMRGHLERLLAYQRRAPEVCLSVPFEGFVQEHARWAGVITAWLGLPERTPTVGHFDPAVSRENIGIGEDDPRTLRFLESHRDALEAVRELRRELDALTLSATPDSPAP